MVAILVYTASASGQPANRTPESKHDDIKKYLNIYLQSRPIFIMCNNYIYSTCANEWPRNCILAKYLQNIHRETTPRKQISVPRFEMVSGGGNNYDAGIIIRRGSIHISCNIN